MELGTFWRFRECLCPVFWDRILCFLGWFLNDLVGENTLGYFYQISRLFVLGGKKSTLEKSGVTLVIDFLLVFLPMSHKIRWMVLSF